MVMTETPGVNEPREEERTGEHSGPPDAGPAAGAATTGDAGPAGAAEPAGEAAPRGEEREPPARRIKIGSQRPEATKMAPKPQPIVPLVDPNKQPRTKKFPVPNIRKELPPEWEQEVEDAFGGITLAEALDSGAALGPADLEPESRHLGRVVSVQREDVFLDLGGRNTGVLPLAGLPEPPQIGGMIEVQVSRFDPDEGLYLLTLPGGAVDVSGWDELAAGIVVEARITGHNKGGLECEVSGVRGFIPAGQASIYRIEDFAALVGERMTCLVTEANRERRNLVLSRRAVQERQQAEAKAKLMAELAEGQEREGIVRSLMDFGAFVDLGGVDGLVHVSQLSWERIKHPSEVVQVGQRIKVRINKIDPASGKISLGFRDLLSDPWATAALKYPVTAVVRGTVTRIVDFGAFVQIEPGIEGLVHVSELAHKRVWRVADVVQVGQEVEVKVLGVDAASRRMSLSMKAAQAEASPPKPKQESGPELPGEAPGTPPPPSKPLKGGLGRGTGGERFGLKW
jgi:small subunit ribosomal protein S1